MSDTRYRIYETGIYGQLAGYGLAFGRFDGGATLTGFKQGSALGVGGMVGWSLSVTWRSGLEFDLADKPSLSAGVAVPSGVPGTTFAALRDFANGITSVSLGYSLSTDVAEIGIYGNVEAVPVYDNPYQAYPGGDKTIGEFFTDFSGASGLKCFPSSTPILLASGESREICDIRVGRLYRNETTEWVRLSWDEDGAARELVVTPGHRFLTERGTFEKIGDMAAEGRATVVLEDGVLTTVSAERIVFSAKTAGLFERTRTFGAASGNAALAPVESDAWQTYNFEVEDLHTYIAGGRVTLGLLKRAEAWSRAKGAREMLFHVTSGVETERTERMMRKLGYEVMGGNFGAFVQLKLR